MKKSKKMAISAIMSALGVALLYIGSLFEVLDISAACIASLVIMLVLTEFGIVSALSVYGVITLLSLLILPQKLPALFFALFFGLWPITKLWFEHIGAKSAPFIGYVLKLVLFNAELLLFGYLAKELLAIPDSVIVVVVYIVMFNAIFILTDILYGSLVRIYFKTIRKRISKYLK